MKKITIYTGPMCNYCEAAKILLIRNNAPFEEIDVAQVEGAKDEMITILGVPGVMKRKIIICKKRI